MFDKSPCIYGKYRYLGYSTNENFTTTIPQDIGKLPKINMTLPNISLFIKDAELK